MRVLFLTNADYIRSPAARQWFYQMHELLAARGIETSLNKFDKSRYDVAIIHRSNPDLVKQALDHSPEAHIGILNPGWDPAHETVDNPPLEVVDNVDFFIVTTFIWRDLVLRFQRRVYLTIDYDTPEGKPVKQHTGTTGLTIGYHGNEVHYAREFFPHGANALQRLAREHDFTLKIITRDVASQPRIDGVKTEFVEFDLETFTDEMMTFDIGICPAFSTMEQLADPLVYVRNSNRVHTLLFYGIPSVTSPLLQACHDLTHGENVFFAVSEDGWYDALKRLITQPDLRNRMGHTGRDMVTKHFSAEVAAQTYLDLLDQEIKMPLFPKKGLTVAPQAEKSHSTQPVTRAVSLPRKFLSYARRKGIGPALKRAARSFQVGQAGERRLTYRSAGTKGSVQTTDNGRGTTDQIPQVSVLMSVYNDERYLREAIESILNQTFTDFEFVIIDDSSTDGSSEILAEYAAQDSRIVLIRNEMNIGLTRSLNKGLAQARGKYIARQDGDDISMPERLARQVQFLEAQPEVGVLGTGWQIIDEAGKPHQTGQILAEHGLLKWRLCFANPITNTMMRQTVVNQANGYSVAMLVSQDYDLWQRLSGVTRLANLPEVLFYLRKHESNVSVRQVDMQYQNGIIISQRMMSDILGEKVPLKLVKLIWGEEFETLDDVCQVAWLIYRLCRAGVKDPALSRAGKRVIRNDSAKWLLRLFRPRKYDIRAWKILGWAYHLDPLLIGGVVTRKARRILRKWAPWAG